MTTDSLSKADTIGTDETMSGFRQTEASLGRMQEEDEDEPALAYPGGYPSHRQHNLVGAAQGSEAAPALQYPGQGGRADPAKVDRGGDGDGCVVLEQADTMSEMVIPTEYSQAEVDKMLRDKEREVKAILQEEDDALKKEIQEINAKLDDAKIHDLRQQEVRTTYVHT